jgi:hypothetical protein
VAAGSTDVHFPIDVGISMLLAGCMSFIDWQVVWIPFS